MASTTSTPRAKAAEALRCRFTDLAGLYLSPGGSQHRIDSLWWWVKFVYDHSALHPTEGGSIKRVFSLGEGHKSNRATWVKGKAYLFALAYKYTAHWRACAETQPQPQQQEGSTDPQAVVVKPDPEDQLLAWLDLLLLIAWKHMSTQTAKSRKGWLAFPFVTLKRATTDESDPAAAVFNDYEYLGLTTIEEANGWQLEWTEEGVKAFQHWSAREDEIKALGSLRRRLIDDRAESALVEARKALETAVGRGRARSARQSKATVIDLTAETVVKLSEEVGALREALSKLLVETKKQKKRMRVKKEKKEKNKKRKREEKENEGSDDDCSDDEDDDDDDDDGDEIDDEGDDQSQTTLSRKRKRQEEEKKEEKSKKKKSDSKKKAKKRRTEEEEEVDKEEEEEKKMTEPEEQEEDDDDGDDGEERRSLVRRRKRRARSLFEMRAGSCAQS